MVIFGGMGSITGSVLGTLLLCALPVVLGVCVYAFAAVKLKAITKADCLLLPKGEKIAKIMKL